MEIRQLNQFCTLANAKSFTLAANQLNIAQPALSQSMKKLEQELGVPLLIRRAGKQNGSVTLTSEGEVLLQHARMVLSQINTARNEIRSMASLEAGEVRIAVPGMLGSFYLPSRLMAFKHQYPGLKLSLFSGGTRDALKMLQQEEVDVAIITAEDLRPEFDHKHLVREQMVVAVAEDHTLAERDKVTLEDFFQHELVMFKKGYFHREWLQQQAEQLGLKADIAFETNLINLIKQLVAQGFAITSMLDMAVSDDEGIVCKPFSPPVFLDLHIAWKQQRPLGQADRTFVDFLLANA